MMTFVRSFTALIFLIMALRISFDAGRRIRSNGRLPSSTGEVNFPPPKPDWLLFAIRRIHPHEYVIIEASFPLDRHDGVEWATAHYRVFSDGMWRSEYRDFRHHLGTGDVASCPLDAPNELRLIP